MIRASLAPRIAGPASVAAAVAGFAWPLLSHGAALAGRPEWMTAITASVGLTVASALMVASRTPLLRIVWLAVALGVALAWRFAPFVLLFLPPAALNVAFGVFFGLSLARGREPRIAAFARLERGGELPPDLALHARRLTWLWTALFVASAVVGLLLAALAPLHVWSAFVNVASYLAMAALLAGDYLYRKLRFPQYRHASLVALVRMIVLERRLHAARGVRR